MESEDALNQTLTALGDISAHDLDEMLEGDISLPDQLLDNAQRLPSQYDDLDATSQFENRQHRADELLDRLEAELLSAQNATKPSVILVDNDDTADVIIDDDSTNDANITEEPVAVDLSKAGCKETSRESRSTLNDDFMTRNENLDPFFEQEFVNRRNKDDDIFASFFEDDLDITEVNVEAENNVGDHEKPTTSKGGGGLAAAPLRFFTQLTPHRTQQQPKECHNISATYPNVNKQNRNPNLNIHSISKNKENSNREANAENIQLRLSSSAANTQKTREEIINLTDNLQDSNKSDHQEVQHHQTPNNDSTISTSATTEFDNNQPVNLMQSTIPYANDASAVPKSIKQLFDLMKAHYSDLTFVYALSAQLCQDRVPMSCYVNVKMALLLSIASCAKNSNIAPIPIILMGNDTYMANFLMTNIANLAARFVGPCDDVKSQPSSDGYRNYNWIEADPIQLAKGGVYYVGDWSCLKSTRSEKIFKDIETTRVAVERTTRIYPLETAIWAHWRAFKYNAKDQQLFNKFVKVFGIPICMDDRNQDTLVDFMLKQASTEIFESTIDHLSVSADDMRKFLATISQRTVDLSTDATNLLRKYFVASRNERPDCLTKQAYVIMKQLAESFAKLSMRHEVLVIDAVGAILMCEDFLQHLYGPGMDPPPMLEDGNFVRDIDTHVARFHEWLQGYIEKYCDKD